MNVFKIIQDRDGAIQVLHDVAVWMEQKNLGHSEWWKVENMNQTFFTKYAEDDEFYCGYADDKPAAAMILQDSERNQSWEFVDHGNKQKALYIHWLAVAREFAGKGLSRKMVEYAAAKAKEQGFTRLRLDTNSNEEKLMKLYEGLGFRLKGIDSEQTAYFQKDL